MWWQKVLRCPVCGAETLKENNSLICLGPKRHTFDFSAEGYLNLSDSRAQGGGDDAVLIAARRAFLQKGYYLPFAARVLTLLREYTNGNIVADAGCGEGYYTSYIARNGFCVTGFDLSKRGVRAAAKAANRAGLDTLFAVSSVFSLPLADASQDAIISLFAPVAESEFLRVLKPNGVLLVAGAGEDHLLDLKKILYDTPRKNLPRADLPHTMMQMHSETLNFTMQLDTVSVADLFAMTPYYYRTSREGKARLAALPALSCGAQMNIYLYRKKEA